MDGLEALEKIFFPDNISMLDMAEIITLWESEPGVSCDWCSHCVTLFMKHGIQTWPCQIISPAFRMTAIDIRRMTELCNVKHDSTAVHITYFEKLEHIREIMPFYKKKLIKLFLNTEMDNETLAESLMALLQPILTIKTDESRIQNDFVITTIETALSKKKKKTLIEYQQQSNNIKNILAISKKLSNMSSEIWFFLLKHYHLSTKQYHVV